MPKKIFTHPLILIVTLPLGIWLWTVGGTVIAWGISTHFCAFAFCYWSLLVLLKIKLDVPKIFFLFGALLLGFLGIFTLSIYRPFWSGPTLVHLAEVIIGLGYLIEFFLVKGPEKLSRKILELIIAAVVLAAALFAFYWFGGKEEPWPTYDNARYEFSLEYPAGWQLGVAPTNNDGRTFTSPDQQIECRAYGFYNALTGPEGNPQTLEEFVAWLVDPETLGEEAPVVLAQKQTMLGNNPAVQLITQEGQKIQEAVYALGEESGRGVVCTFPSPEAQKAFGQDFERMVRTFQCRTNLNGASAEEGSIPGT